MRLHQLSSLFVAGLLLGLVSTAYADEMAATEAYTLWFVIFNQPAKCVGSPCGIIDVMGQDFLDSIEAGAPNPALIAPNAAVSIGIHVLLMSSYMYVLRSENFAIRSRRELLSLLFLFTALSLFPLSLSQ